MYLLNNVKINIRAPLTGPDGTQYPANWFAGAGARSEAGVVEVSDPIYPDEDLYTYTENADGSLTIAERTPEDIAARTQAAADALQAAIEAQALRAERVGLTAQIDKLTAAINQYQALLDVPYIEPAQAGTTALELAALRGRMRDVERNARDLWRDMIIVLKTTKYLSRQSRRSIS